MLPALPNISAKRGNHCRALPYDPIERERLFPVQWVKIPAVASQPFQRSDTIPEKHEEGLKISPFRAFDF